MSPLRGVERWFGPGTLVAAAFLGPGTVTVCTLAGAEYGFALLWALLFSTLATIVLQEMAARLGWVTQDGLGAAIRAQSRPGLQRLAFFTLVLSAILVGNAAYEAGNISGAVLGLDELAGSARPWPLLLGALAFGVLHFGRYRLVERLLIALVLLMSVCFVVTAVLARPAFGPLLEGLFVPRMPSGALLSVIALVGTTVVPYNLFLHASSVPEKWGPQARLRDIRTENAVAVGLGGIISMGIVIVAAAGLHGTGATIRSAADMAVQLEPLLGDRARILLALGLFAAGISSAITAPLAAAYAARGLFAWPHDWRDRRFRAVWFGVLVTGVVFASLGIRPVRLIQFAQVANGLMLPVVASFLLVLANRSAVMGAHRNRVGHNVLGTAVVLVTLVLSLRAIASVLGLM